MRCLSVAGWIALTLLATGAGTAQAPLAVEGFSIERVDDGALGFVTALCFQDDGTLWATEVDGRIVRMDDAMRPVPFATLGPRTLGCAFEGATLWVSSADGIVRYRDLDDDGSPDPVAQTVFHNLQPDGSGHTSNNLLVADGWIYFGSGSLGDVDVGTGRLRAAVARFTPARLDGAALPIDAENETLLLQVYARGLRNAYGLAALPDGRIVATDNGEDGGEVPDELNVLREGAHYGFPGGGGEGPVATFEPHSAPGAVDVHRGAWCSHAGAAFVALYGAYQPGDPRGRKVVAVDLSGSNASVKDFAWGLGRPLALKFDPSMRDLYVSASADDGTSALYRVASTRACEPRAIPVPVGLALAGVGAAALLRRLTAAAGGP